MQAEALVVARAADFSPEESGAASRAAEGCHTESAAVSGSPRRCVRALKKQRLTGDRGSSEELVNVGNRGLIAAVSLRNRDSN